MKRGQCARRAKALSRQSKSREKRLARARSVMMAPAPLPVPDDSSAAMEDDAQSSRTQDTTSKNEQKRHEKRRAQERIYAEQFMRAEWMIDVPDDLRDQWLVLPRPEGQRCMVVANGGQTVSRTKRGRLLHRFQSALPNGSRSTAGNTGPCILDCVYQEGSVNGYLVIDVVCWKNYSLYDCNTEFRFFWAISKFQEITVNGTLPRTASNDYPFTLIPYSHCSPEAIAAAYRSDFGFIKDGLLFYNREARYAFGTTPLVLRWKDAACSRYCINSQEGPLIAALQYFATDRSLRTAEGFIVARALQQDFEDGKIARFSIGMLTETPPDTSLPLNELGIYLSEVQHHSKCGKSRFLPDALSKIAFQSLVRDGKGLSIQSIAGV